MIKEGALWHDVNRIIWACNRFDLSTNLVFNHCFKEGDIIIMCGYKIKNIVDD